MPAQEMTLQSESGQSGLGSNGAGNILKYHASKTSAGNGDWIRFPRGIKNVSVILNSTGDGRIEVCNGTYDEVTNDTVPAAAIVPWPHGDIGIATQEISIDTCQAFRMVNISGTTTLNAIAHQN